MLRVDWLRRILRRAVIEEVRKELNRKQNAERQWMRDAMCGWGKGCVGEVRIQQDCTRIADRVYVEVTRSKLEAIAYSVVNLVLKKNKDYGDAWQGQGINGALVRLADKLYRVDTLADGRERLVQDENVLDTLVDAIGYALLGILYLQENGMGSLDE